MSVDFLPTETHRFYVTFELRPEEDRAASIAQGHPVFVDVEYAIVTMPGGSLVVDKKITPDLLNQWKFGKGKNPPSPFAVTAYEAWKQGLEAPVNGTDLKNWPGVTPAQIKMCHLAAVHTVEDLAQASEDVLRKLGMGSRALKDKAQAYLKAAVANQGSEEIASLKVRMEALEQALKDRDEKIAALESEQGEDQPKRKPGRPPKNAE